MENPEIPNDKKQFICTHCSGKILVPRDLPPTTAPCPYCGGTITSPAGDGSTSSGPPPAPVAVSVQVSSPPAGPPPVPPPAVIAALVQGPPPPPVVETPPQAQPPQTTARVVPATPAPAREPQPAPVRAEKVRKPEPAAKALPPQQTPKKKLTPAKPQVTAKSGGFPIALVSLLLLGGGALTYFVTKEMNREIPPPSVASAETLTPLDANYIRIGWQKDATRLLNDFLAAEKAGEKLPFILNADSLATRVRGFYGDGVINDSDTPAGAFSVYELSEEDRKRGLFMMTYDQPPQFEMREFFRPLATLEVQYGIDEADMLLSTVARAGNFAMEPLRVHAFFKKTSAGLKLDWEIFSQTKYRTFRSFTELPEPGHTGVFRVFIVEDVPDRTQPDPLARTYRLSDPAHTDDAARVNVKQDSDIGRSLSQLNWLGTKGGSPLTRTATVELAWSGGNGPPQLQLRRFICWEFLGLGGQDAKPTASAK
jgi:hypothetical protein